MVNTYLFISFAIGIAAGWHRPVPAAVLLFLVISSFAGLIISARSYKNRAFPSFLIALFFFLGAVWVTPYALHKPDEFMSKDNTFLIKVISLPQKLPLKNVFYARIINANGCPINIKAKVNWFHKKQAGYRNTYYVRGKLSRRKFKKTYFYTLWLKRGLFIKEMPSNFIDNFIRRFTYTTIDYFKSNLSYEAYEFLSSVFLGRRELLSKRMKAAFVYAGAAHLIAISGLHVGIISGILFLALKIFRIKFRSRIALSIIFMFFYALCAGARPSIVRSSLMFTFVGLGFFLKRKVSIFDTLSVSGIVCLFLNPLWVFDIGFQLSFTAVFAIAAGNVLFPSSFRHKNKSVAYAKGILFSTLFVTIAIVPLISFYFGKPYVIGILSNLVLIPILTFILTVAFIYIWFYLFPFLAKILADILSFSIFIFVKIALLLGGVKFSSFNINMSAGELILYYMVLGTVLFLIYYKGSPLLWLKDASLEFSNRLKLRN